MNATASAIDEHTRFAARLIGAPVALVSSVERAPGARWERVALPEPLVLTPELRRAHAASEQIVAGELAVPRAGDRVHPSPDVDARVSRTADGLTLLATPVRDDEGRTLGTLFAVATCPRRWAPRDVEALAHAAWEIASELSLRGALAVAEDARAAAEAEYRAIVDAIGEVAFRTDVDGNWTMLTPAWREITGRPVHEALGISFLEFVDPDHREVMRLGFATLVAGECTVYDHIVRTASRDGRPRWMQVRVRTTHDAAGRITGTFGTLNDVTEHQLERIARREIEEQLRLALDVAGLSVWERRLPAPGHEHRWMDDVAARVHPDDVAQVKDALLTLRDDGDTHCEYRVARGGGEYGWAHTVARTLPVDGGPARIICVSLDTTPRREAALALERKSSMLEATLEATGDGLLVVDLDGCVADYNRRLLELLHLVDTGFIGAELRPMFEHVLPQHVVGAGVFPPRVEFADGRIVECTSRPQWLDGSLVGRVWSFRDVTASAVLEAQLVHQAYHDALTGLANRAQLRLRVERALSLAESAGRAADHIAVLLLDLDGFKLVNDAAGHAAGDAVLRQVAERLLNATRGSDLVARLGGDEFGVLLERVRDDADVVVVAERITAAMREPFTVLGTTVVIGTSIGIARGFDAAMRDPFDAPLAPVDALLRNADLALYEAKARGKGQYAVFELGLHDAALERVSLEAALRRGLDRGEFRLDYQPIFDLSSRRPTGVEALVRWHSPERGLVSPGQFIPLAEETGLIVSLGRWVLEEACRQGAQWAHRSAEPLSITVNVSGRQLQQPTFVAEVQSALERSGLPACHLLLELTETTVIRHPEVALERLTALKALGVRLAIDDFGTGYSALSYLQKFPFDVLKIDKSFVDHVADGGQDTALAGAIVALGNALSLRTIAEGVETAAQGAALAALGCASAQGYHFARPLPASEIDALLT